MRHAYVRRLGGAAAIAVAAGLLAAPPASADGGLRVTGTTASPQPRVSVGVRTDACDEDATPGWIGQTGDGPVLNATVASDTSGALSARFAVWDRTTGSDTAVFSGVTTADFAGRARITVPGLVDGHSYTWQVRALQGHHVSAPAPDCHFRLDTTRPSVTVSSPEFPASGKATKYAGQVGSFTFTGADAAPAGGEASKVACYVYSFQMLGVSDGSCTGWNTVPAGPDGTATVQLKALNWGTNILNVQAIDTAGNASWSTSYTFYAPSDPNPPSTLGDVDGDGTADILLPDAQGNLQYISVNAPGTTPNWTVPARYAPNQERSWTPLQIAHRGWQQGDHAPSSDDLFIHEPGGGALNLYRNFDYGGLQGSMTTARRSTSCQDSTGAPATCPADYASDWSKVDQLVAFGPVSGGSNPSLITLEGGNLWLHSGGNFSYGWQKVRKLTTAGDWNGYDLVAPGPDAAGNLALWARERATGDLHAYPVPKKADGTYDFTALADPKANVVASGFTVDAYPTLGSSGDADGDGKPDLWAVTADRHLVTYSGWSDRNDLGALR
ncbi:hypothetical protein F7Q99_09915 [Streptomyces kaniharaensis]|uniref:VCBS repeat-containing protein n=1 Tax=Streptomyces kaniharaensis TaxID=212423 RepID=A0A6N7KRF0_9ACTN|nr:hypothetical protein [Streptomyces kaniharaensis]MQS12594.1 hypothetical protein [Streptomyces kaniharaensis]